MAALTADRNTPEKVDANIRDLPVKASTTIFAGSLVCLDASGWAVPGATATTLVAVGRAEQKVANSGANGALNVRVRRGVYRFGNSTSTDLIARTEIGKDCYIVDDQTVAKTNGSTTRSVAGKVFDVDANGVWVEI